MPGRPWQPDRRYWVVADPARALECVYRPFGQEGVVVTGVGAEAPAAAQSPPAEPDLATSTDLLVEVRRGLVLRGYSARTRSVYLGHVRRFLDWAGRTAEELPEDRGRGSS
jgi:hypothetical protein